MTDVDLSSTSELRLLELGSGLGKSGLLAHHLALDVASTVLTDGDINTLQMLRRNVALNATFDDTISCQQLIWGEAEAEDFLLSQQDGGQFHVILGSDLIYTRSDTGYTERALFKTVGTLLHNREGRFFLAHDERHGVPVKRIVDAARFGNLFHEELKSEGQVHILCFRKLWICTASRLLTSLQDKNRAQKEEIRALRAEKEYLEGRCRRLEERCVSLRGDRKDLPPQSIMLSFGIDHAAHIASFLESQDLANLSSTCKQFGLKLHNHIGTRDVSLWQMIAHGLYESASEREKETLPACDGEVSPFLLYSELVELRKPLVFAQLFGRGIKHASGEKSHIVKCDISGFVKIPLGGRLFDACTAVSSNVMRSGKHCVSFECPEGHGGDYPLWFGVVRPIPSKSKFCQSLFTPFCSRFIRDLGKRRTEEWGDVQCCVYSATSGKCLWTGWNEDDHTRAYGDRDFASDDESTGGGLHSAEWQGMQSFGGGTISLLLDFDAGSLTVFKDTIRLGVMKKNLVGPYSWMVSVHTQMRLPTEYSNEGIKIERAWVDQLSSLPCKRELSEI